MSPFLENWQFNQKLAPLVCKTGGANLFLWLNCEFSKKGDIFVSVWELEIQRYVSTFYTERLPSSYKT